MSLSRKLVTVGLVGTMGMFSACSCASKEDLSKVRSELAEVRTMSEESLSAARDARQMAQDSNSRSLKIEESMNRSFKKSMYK